MIPQEVLRKVRRIEILTGRLVSETFAGEYLSVFKGRGMEFAEVREYSEGDDVRTIDWNVTARSGRPFVRQYTEERELTVVIACDLSGSQYFGTAQSLKNEISAELSAVLAFSALQNHDKVGLFLFTEGVEEYVPPKKGRKHILHLIRDVLAYKPAKTGTKIGPTLDTINRVLKRRCILFLISDFRDEGFERPLRMAALKHDVIPVVVTDPREQRLPKLGALLELEDPETGRRTVLDASRTAALASLEKLERERQDRLERLFKQSGLVPIRVGTDRSYIDAIVAFFRLRAKRLRH
ncbi:MAG: DUF58 domain-containing protein [Elusimicrobia bacterium]|nr:DUF58 domain-containing protein [Elusimicrobiota bacterium]